MKQREIIAADKCLIPVDKIDYVDIDHLPEEGFIDVRHDGQVSRISGFFAIEAVMLLKPGALEGKRMRWQKRAWLMHNLVAHPLMQIMALAAEVTRPVSPSASQKLYRAAMRLHDETVPAPIGFRDKTPQAKLG
jgi:hypothetical protein